MRVAVLEAASIRVTSHEVLASNRKPMPVSAAGGDSRDDRCERTEVPVPVVAMRAATKARRFDGRTERHWSTGVAGLRRTWHAVDVAWRLQLEHQS